MVKNLALVDDDELYVFITTKMIEKSQLVDHIDVFGNGKEILDFVQNKASDGSLLPDVIFLDLSMPIMDGWQFLDRFAECVPEIEKSIEIFICSSSISPEDIKKANSLDLVTDYVIKPLNRSKIESMLADAKNN